jgi:hypothetical protein
MKKSSLLLFAVIAILNLTFCTNQKPDATTEKKAYLLTYFKDNTRSLYFALSTDGYTFTDVNNGEPVVAGDTIASQKGIRDPHISRGPDGAFYVAMTDLHLFARQIGYRTTTWERPIEDQVPDADITQMPDRRYCMMYVAQEDPGSIKMAFSDYINFKDLGHFNEGVMKTTKFTSPKNEAVIQLTEGEALTLAGHWNMELKF